MFSPAAADLTQPVPEAWARFEQQRAAARADCPSVAIDHQRLRTTLDQAFDVIFPLDDITAKNEHNRDIIERRWVDGATRKTVAAEFSVSEYRIKAIEDIAFKKLIPLRHRFIDHLDSIPDWLRVLNQSRNTRLPKQPTP
jgi:DNA-directed RNA polymerase sigma subunit (sigma70/sigma32)